VYLRYTTNKSHVFDSQQELKRTDIPFLAMYWIQQLFWVITLQHFSDAAIVVVRIKEQWFCIKIYYIHVFQ